MSGPLPSILSPLTIPASWVYGLAVRRRNARFDRGEGMEAVDRPVISVGNLTTGGTGKTPLVAWIARRLSESSLKPLIAMRGYKARPNEMSDEEAEYRELLPEVPVVANPDRITALREFLGNDRSIDCVILDDGFQHRQLKRDLDLVLIDATAGTLRDQLLPAGNLREPIENLQRADAVIITHAHEVDQQLAQRIERFHGWPPLAWTRHQWSGLTLFESAGSGVEAIDWLRGKRVLAMLGVGKPESIHTQLEALGTKVAVNIPAADHEIYDRPKVAMARGLADGCDAMVVTGKDWVKIRDLIDWKRWPVPIVVPRLEIDVFAGAVALRERLLSVIRTAPAGKPAR